MPLEALLVEDLDGVRQLLEALREEVVALLLVELDHTARRGRLRGAQRLLDGAAQRRCHRGLDRGPQLRLKRCDVHARHGAEHP